MRELFGPNKEAITFPIDKDVWGWARTLEKSKALEIEAKMVAVLRREFHEATGLSDSAWGPDFTDNVREE